MAFFQIAAEAETAAERARALGFFENEWPGSFTLPFGEWFVQLIKWAQFNPVTAQIGDMVEWPFSTLFNLILSDRVGRDSITTIPWLWVVIAVFVIGSIARNTRVGLSSAVMLAACGFLGTGTISGDFWFQTSRTIGMILVSVLVCAIIGIPLGILSGRADAVWTVVRPALDAMQVVHSFVYMLPFIFFFGIGEVSATMVTMVFALPPIVRLTNLGIRQVPEDVVEAARAYGATELRVLTDVQLPLARPAILTGLNQTLLLSIAMLGIAALMGAGGLGKLLFRAINNFDLRLAAGGGLAFFLVAVTFDRITQSEDDDGISFFAKLSQAWRYRSDPEGLLDERSSTISGEAPTREPTERTAPIESAERTGLMITALGSAVALISVFLTWGNDTGLVSGWGRSIDLDLAGESFNGLSASGGSFFGIFVAVLALLALLASVRPLLSIPQPVATLMVRIQGLAIVGIIATVLLIWVLNMLDTSFGPFPDLGLALFAIAAVAILLELYATGTPRLGADGALIAAIGVTGAALGYLFLRAAPGAGEYSDGIGVYIAIIGGFVAVAGALMATLQAPYASRKPLPLTISYSQIGSAVGALLLVIGGALLTGNTQTKTEFGWYFDLTDEFQAELAGEGSSGEDSEELADEAAITDLLTDTVQADSTRGIEVDAGGSYTRIVFNGVEDDGPGLGLLAMLLGVFGLAAAIPASGLTGRGEVTRWKASVLLCGIGIALMAVPMGFILGMVRVAEPGALSGVGAFVTLVAGFLLFASGRGVVAEFRRRKIYRDAGSNSAVVGPNDAQESADSSHQMAEV
ncbi:MAG: ABC transporter permease subunit [Acidimicrobiales bacterium]|nr:ABC transporter permease subunit [Acidimicrobiales bacterium]